MIMNVRGLFCGVRRLSRPLSCGKRRRVAISLPLAVVFLKFSELLAAVVVLHDGEHQVGAKMYS